MKTARPIYTVAALLTAVSTVFLLSVSASDGFSSGRTSPAPKTRTITSQFYTVRPDLRRCVTPLCGGYWVKRVNHALTRCANGRNAAECYAAEIDWGEQPPVEPRGAILRGDIVRKVFGPFGNLGAFRVSETWQPATNSEPSGVFYELKDRGIRCITYPCLTINETKLNSTAQMNIAGVNLEGAGAHEDLVANAMREMAEGGGLIVAGSHARVTGPAGRASELKATQFYFRAHKQSSETKPCIKSGCSNHVCADENVITTCEWRPEYGCYQKAKCERQADGKCGFSRTPELIDCLKKAKESSGLAAGSN